MSTCFRLSLRSAYQVLCVSTTFLLFLVSAISCSRDRKEESENVVENIFYDRAFDFREQGQLDSAFLYFYRAKDLFTESGNRFGAGKCLVNMAIIMAGEADFYGSQEVSLEAEGYFEPEDPEQSHYLASNYNNLGITSLQLWDFDNALKFYDTALRYSTDSAEKLITLTNIAKVYEAKGDLAQAITIYSDLTQYDVQNQLAYARTLTNFSVAKWLMDTDTPILRDLLKAMFIRIHGGDLQGLNSSYYHLARYYIQAKSDSALHYSHKMYSLAHKLQSEYDQLFALELLIQSSEADSAKFYFSKYQKLNDKLQLTRNAAKNQFALIRYEVEKSKAETLRFQKENDRKAYQLGRQRILTGILLLLGAIAAVFVYYFQKRRKQKLELESQHRIKAHQLKTSKKIHDVVANGIYRVMATIENQSEIDREKVLDQLESMYEKSRDLSYESGPSSAEETSFSPIGFNLQIAELLKSFASESIRVLIAGNTPDLWDGIRIPIQEEVLFMLQELMVNMKKHSEADQVVVRFEQAGPLLIIHYRDNGIGLPADFQFGNGLKSTGNRIEVLCGTINFDNGKEGGLQIRISIPALQN